LGEPIPGKQAGELGIATHVVPGAKLDAEANALAKRLASGPTRSYAATRTLLKAWSGGGITAADAMMLDVTMDLFNTQDVQRGFVNTAKAFDANIPPPEMTFEGKESEAAKLRPGGWLCRADRGHDRRVPRRGRATRWRAIGAGGFPPGRA